MKIIKTTLKPGEYVREVHHKKQIVLHYSASASVRYLRDWFNQQPGAIATSYGVEPNGDIYYLFAPCYWAYHTGAGASVDRHNIGIEIANVGYLERRVENGQANYYSQNPATGKFTVPYYGNVFSLAKPHKEFTKWAAFPEAQIEATAKLCALLCNMFDIPATILKSLDYNESFRQTAGIVGHHNLHLQKSDPGPAFNYNLFEECLRANL